MKTLTEPRQDIVKLWGKQAVRPEETYRMMRYVLRVDHNGKTALHNVITGQLIVLDSDEAELLNALPNALPFGYTPIMDSLIANHYLVPKEYDECKQVVNLRTILRKLAPKPKYITHYTILPTTACNARCYYCFEQGTKTITMTEETAEQVIHFIAEHCGPDKKISITWFGGEPTVAPHRIDQICEGLQIEGIAFSSMMYTNGYLFDEEMVQHARSVWHVNHIQMTVDGTEAIYNKIKAYVNASDNPYQRVIRNIGLMLDNGITVAVRMNVDYINHQHFAGLVNDLDDRYHGNKLLSVCAYNLIGEYRDHDGVLNHADDAWMEQRVVELNEFARTKGFIHASYELPSLRVHGCMGENDACISIGAAGNLVRCAEQFEDNDTIGTVGTGITNLNRVKEWKEIFYSEQCSVCPFFPRCIQLSKCSGAGHCYQHFRKQKYIWKIENLLENS